MKRTVGMLAAGALAAGLLVGLAASAQARPIDPEDTYAPQSWLCRARTDAPVYRESDAHWIYTIGAGHDMRVYYDGMFTYPHGRYHSLYGHGNGHDQNGWSPSFHFYSPCRAG